MNARPLLLLALLALPASAAPAPAAELAFRVPGSPASANGSLDSHTLTLRPDGPFARATWTVTLVNGDRGAIEGRLAFRIPVGALLTAAGLNDRGVRSVAKLVPRRAGRRAYTSIMNRLMDPLLVECAGDRAVARVFPVEPGRTVAVEFSFALRSSPPPDFFAIDVIPAGRRVPPRVEGEVPAPPPSSSPRAPAVPPLIVFDTSGSTRGAAKRRLLDLLAAARERFPASPLVDFAGQSLDPAALESLEPRGPSDPTPALAAAGTRPALLVADPSDLRFRLRPEAGGAHLLADPASPLSDDASLRAAAGLLVRLAPADLPACAAGLPGPADPRFAPPDPSAKGAAALFAAARDLATIPRPDGEAAKAALAAGILCRHTAFLAVPEEVAGRLGDLDPLLPLFGPPNFNRARSQARGKACLANMKTIEGAAELYLMEHEVARSAEVTLERLAAEGYLKTRPVCPGNGVYVVSFPDGGGASTPEVFCSVHGSVEAAEIALFDAGDVDQAARMRGRFADLAAPARLLLLALMTLAGGSK